MNIGRGINKLLGYETTEVTPEQMANLVEERLIPICTEKELDKLKKGMKKTWVLLLSRSGVRCYPSWRKKIELTLKFDPLTHKLYAILLEDREDKNAKHVYVLPKGKEYIKQAQQAIMNKLLGGSSPAQSAPTVSTEPQKSSPVQSQQATSVQPQQTAPKEVTIMKQRTQTTFQNTPISKLKTNKSLLKYILLSIITFGIYGIVVLSSVSTDINQIATKYDGKKTMHYCLLFFLINPITLGIASFVWNHKLSSRMDSELKRRNIAYDFGASSFWLWGVIGIFIIVGPFVYLHELLKATNLLCEDYNING